VAALFGAAPEPQPRIERIGFMTDIDPQTRTARWTFEHLSLASINGPAERKGHFSIDPTQEPASRATEEDREEYARLGYDAFHLAAAGNHGGQLAKDATFFLTNAPPGDKRLNRGLWKLLEETIRDLVDVRRQVDVVTMPLYLPNAQNVIEVKTIGRHRVWVPTHFAKAILLIREGEPIQTLAWIVPNETPVNPKDLDRWRVPVDQLEFHTGLDLFADLDDVLEKKLEACK